MTQEPYEIEWKDYYKILQITENTTEDEIKKNYRQLAKYYHPDNNPNNIEAEAKFKEINEAYMILGDNNRRQKYDYYYNMISQKNTQSYNKENNSERIKLLLSELERLRKELIDHKIKLATGNCTFVIGITGHLFNINSYINIIQNKEELNKFLSFFIGLYTTLVVCGLNKVLKERKFDTKEHLERMSVLETEIAKEFIRVLRF